MDSSIFGRLSHSARRGSAPPGRRPLKSDSVAPAGSKLSSVASFTGKKAARFQRFFYAFLGARISFSGWITILLALAIFFACLNTGHNPFYLLLSLLIGLFLLQWIVSGIMLKGIEAVRRHPSTVFAGSKFNVGLLVSNKKRRIPSFSLQLEDYTGRGKASPLNVSLLGVGAGEKVPVRYPLIIDRRGIFRFKGVKVSTSFPFGFLVRSRYLVCESEIMVYPRLGRVRMFFPKAPPAFKMSGVRRPFLRTLEEEFHGLREYRLGDNPRDIHWKSSAKWNIPLVKEYESAGENIATIILDTHVPNSSDLRRTALLERAISFAGSLARDLVARNYEVALLAFTPELEVIKTVPDRARLRSIYRTLALLGPSRRKGLGALLEESRGFIPSRGLKFFILLGAEEADTLTDEFHSGSMRIFNVASDAFSEVFKME